MPIRLEGMIEGIGTDRKAMIGGHWKDQMFAEFYPGFRPDQPPRSAVQISRPDQSGNASITSITSIAGLSLVLFTSY